MRREKILIIVGVLFALSPFFGLPPKVMTGISILLGLAVIGIGYSLLPKKSVPSSVSE